MSSDVCGWDGCKRRATGLYRIQDMLGRVYEKTACAVCAQWWKRHRVSCDLVRSLVKPQDEQDWSPDPDDPAFDAGYNFVDRNIPRADGWDGPAPWWYGWMVRRAFWEGAKWARENPVEQDVK